MDNKITTSGLAAMLALATGKQKELCENFVSILFAIVEEELTKGENIRIKGFGTFKLVDVEPRKSVNVVTGEDYEIPGHTKVIFVMAKELASLVNAPFDAFETVEIADELPTDGLDGDVEVDMDLAETESTAAEELLSGEESSSEDSKLEEEKPVAAEESVESDEMKEASEEGAQGDIVVAETSEEIVEPVNVADEEENVVSDENMADEEETSAYEDEEVVGDEREESFWKRYKFIIGFIAGICASVLIGWLAVSMADYLEPSANEKEDVAAVEKVEVEEVAEEEPVVDTASVPTQPSDTPVYDTVSTTRYLTTIAKEHYGNFNLWPIIYEENAAILGHPDRIKPGTKVVVPPLAKYGIDPANADQVNEIKEKGRAIYARYK